jgi:hypothetical protein
VVSLEVSWKRAAEARKDFLAQAAVDDLWLEIHHLKMRRSGANRTDHKL